MKKKIISVVLVMTMVFALLAVSASARPVLTPTEIDSVTVNGIPATVYYGDTRNGIMSAVKVARSENYYLCDVSMWTATASLSTINTTGTINVGFYLTAKNGYCFKFKEGDDNDAVFDGTAILPSGVTAEGIFAYNGDDDYPEPGDTATMIMISVAYQISNTNTRPANEPLFVPDTPIESVTIKMPSALTTSDTGKGVVDGLTALALNNEYSLSSATLYAGATEITTGTSSLTAGSYTLVVYLDATDGYHFKYETTNYHYDGTVLTTPDGTNPTSPENLDIYYEYLYHYTPAIESYSDFSSSALSIGRLPTRVQLSFTFTIAGETPVPPTPIESITITIPQTLAVGNDIATLLSGVSENSDKYSIYDVYFYDSSAKTTGKISAGDWYLYVILKAEEGNTFAYEFDSGTWTAVPKATITPDANYYEVCTAHDKSAHSCSCAPEDRTSGDYIVAEYKYTVTDEDPVIPDPGGDDPIPGGDFNLFGKLFGFIRWKKLWDDIKAISIISAVFKFIEDFFSALFGSRR